MQPTRRTKRRKPVLSTATELDRLMVKAVHSIGTPTSRKRKIFGPVYVDSDPVQVYVDGSCLDNGTPRARAGAGIFFGPSHRGNRALRVPGEQTNNRGEAYAVLQAIISSDVHKRLIIFSDSEWTIRTLTEWICERVGMNWGAVSQGDIFADIVWLIFQRPAPVDFRKVKAHSGNAHNDGADGMAKQGAALPAVPPYQPLNRELMAGAWCGCDLCTASVDAISEDKVTTDLPPGRSERDVAARDRLVNADGVLTARSAQGLVAQRRGRATVLGAATWRGVWKGINGLRKPPPLAAFGFPVDPLAATFKGRMNMADPPLDSFDVERRTLNAALIGVLGDHTTDLTIEKIFSTPFTVEEVAEAKRKLKHREGSAAGGDGITYKEILLMDNEAVLELCNGCVDRMDAPTSWVRTVLVGLCKKGKPVGDPNSYRTVGLESCLGKFMTQLVTTRLVAFADLKGLLPPSQNGFREGYRTCNNMFILQGAIHRAKASKKPLYLAYVDMTNAFPSTDHATLWLKLRRMGAGGPIFDRLRWLYREMTYVVRHGGEESEAFRSNMGILIGDTCSPILWALFMSDLPQFMEGDEGKVEITGARIGCLEQADDILLLSTTPEGLQLRLNAVARWCRINFLEVNESKSVVMVIGRKAGRERIFSICGVPIVEVDRQVYVGFTVTSTGQLLRNHYDVKMEQALAAGRQIWSFEQDLGELSPAMCIHLYETVVAPHLLYGCEIALDVHPTVLSGMQGLIDEFLRRVLGLGKRSMVDVLRTETGIKELRYWRLLHVLQYIQYILRCPEGMWDALLLEFEGHPSWITDLKNVIKKLPFPVPLPVLEEWLVPANISWLEKAITKGMDRKLLDYTNITTKLYLIHGRVELVGTDGRARPVPRMRRPYLELANPKHRKALTRILLSNHTMAVEVWQYAKTPIPREARVCRYGCGEVETPEHIWLQCLGCADLVEVRSDLQRSLVAMCSRDDLATLVALDGDVVEQMRKLVSLPHCVAELGRYAYAVEQVLDRTPLEWK